MGKDLNEGNFEKKYLMVDKFSKVTYIKDKKKLLESDLYIGTEGVLRGFIFRRKIIINKILNYSCDCN